MTNSVAKAEIRTVTGPIDPSSAGLVLPHEHVYARLWDPPQVATVAYGGMYGEVHIEDDTLANELDLYRAYGGRTLVDVTVRGMNPQPERLRTMSERTQIRIVAGCGWYREPFYPPEDLIDRKSPDELAEELVRECTEGLAGSTVRPGIIGEIGVNTRWMTALEERVHRAAARAHRQTGLAITTHSPWTPIGLRQLEVFEEEGADLTRVVIGHACSYPVGEYYRAVLERGAYLQFDNIGQFDIPGYQDRITRHLLDLIDSGHASQLLLSHDVWNVKAFAFAGGTGYVGLLRDYLPHLREHGVDDQILRQITIDNPQKVLAVAH